MISELPQFDDIVLPDYLKTMMEQNAELRDYEDRLKLLRAMHINFHQKEQLWTPPGKTQRMEFHSCLHNLQTIDTSQVSEGCVQHVLDNLLRMWALLCSTLVPDVTEDEAAIPLLFYKKRLFLFLSSIADASQLASLERLGSELYCTLHVFSPFYRAFTLEEDRRNLLKHDRTSYFSNADAVCSQLQFDAVKLDAFCGFQNLVFQFVETKTDCYAFEYKHPDYFKIAACMRFAFSKLIKSFPHKQYLDSFRMLGVLFSQNKATVLTMQVKSTINESEDTLSIDEYELLSQTFMLNTQWWDLVLHLLQIGMLQHILIRRMNRLPLTSTKILDTASKKKGSTLSRNDTIRLYYKPTKKEVVYKVKKEFQSSRAGNRVYLLEKSDDNRAGEAIPLNVVSSSLPPILIMKVTAKHSVEELHRIHFTRLLQQQGVKKIPCVSLLSDFLFKEDSSALFMHEYDSFVDHAFTPKELQESFLPLIEAFIIYSEQYCHGDLKPNNLYVDQESAVLVADFELPCQQLTPAEGYTLDYADPCAWNEDGTVVWNNTSDLFSLGLIYLEKASGRRVLPQGTSKDQPPQRNEKLIKILLDRLRTNYHEEFVNLLQILLRENLEERTMSLVKQQVEKWKAVLQRE